MSRIKTRKHGSREQGLDFTTWNRNNRVELNKVSKARRRTGEHIRIVSDIDSPGARRSRQQKQNYMTWGKKKRSNMWNYLQNIDWCLFTPCDLV